MLHYAQNLRFLKLGMLLVLILIVTSCSDNNPYDCEIHDDIVSRNDSIMEDGHYQDGFLELLKDYNEPSLEKYDSKVFRLTITYSFERETWIYKMEEQNDGGLLTIKKSYTEGYQDYAGVQDTTLKIDLTSEQWNELEATFGSNCFWTLPITIDRRGLDGRNCILEAFDPDGNNPTNKKYFAAARWSPEANSEFRRICDAIEQLDPEY